MSDQSITYGGRLSERHGDEAALLAELLADLKGEAVSRGWHGAAVTAYRVDGGSRQIEIAPATGWALTVEALQAFRRGGRR
jgi:hypothetical protein